LESCTARSLPRSLTSTHVGGQSVEVFGREHLDEERLRGVQILIGAFY
jgi:hypothetical protein